MEELPAWLTPLPDAETTRAIDSWAIEQQGVPGLELMERAGAGTARLVERLAPDGPLAILCGKGNNGGDGLVVARLLREAGREARVLCTAPPGELTGDARENLLALPGQPPLRLDGTPWARSEPGGEPPSRREEPLGWAAAIVDALLGTGFEGEPRGQVAEAIEAINRAGRAVVSVDVPSGVDASTGVVRGLAVRATVTATFNAAKPGLWIRPGKDYAGQIEIVDIGIPRGAPMGASIGLLEDGVLALLPRRGPASTKFVSGHVLVVGGSRGLTGAPAMASRSAMRTGAGYVTALVPAELQPVLAGNGTLELMTRGLPEVDGALREEGVEEVLQALSRGGALALALGPGLGRQEHAAGFARRLARGAAVPMVLDADGLNAHAGRLSELSARTAPTVLTPHAGELGRLLERDSAEIEGERLRYVREASRLAGAVVVLKGDDTLIAEPAGRVAVSRGGSPALATAGTGDVLTGVIAALLAEGLDPFAAAAAAVLLHARAGRLAARSVGASEAVMATDVIEALARSRGEGDEGTANA
ncbi:MAG: NAD(P)H-hydrate dehydratase [Solirubrobacteraceae bacterium]